MIDLIKEIFLGLGFLIIPLLILILILQNRRREEQKLWTCGSSCGLVIGTALKIIGTTLKIIGTFRSPRKNYRNRPENYRNHASSYRNIISLLVETACPEEYESVKGWNQLRLSTLAWCDFLMVILSCVLGCLSLSYGYEGALGVKQVLFRWIWVLFVGSWFSLS